MKKHRYRSMVRKMWWMYPAIYAIGFPFGVFFSSRGGGLPTDPMFYVTALGGMLTMMLVSMIPIWLLSRRFFNMQIWLGEDALVYQNGKRETIIPYREIASIKTPSFNYLGGFLMVNGQNGKSIRLGANIEDIHELVIGLKEKLDDVDMSHVYDRKKLFAFAKTGTLGALSWDRYGRLLKNAAAISGASLLGGLSLILVLGMGAKMLTLLGAMLACFVAVMLVTMIWSDLAARSQIEHDAIKSDFTTAEENPKRNMRFLRRAAWVAIGMNLVTVLGILLV